MMQLVQVIVCVAAVLTLIIVQVWWAALIIIVFSTPMFWLSMQAGKKNYQAGRDADITAPASLYQSISGVFQKLAEGKCAVIVTHRLGSAKLAHKIVVMDSGEITDIGTHEELISRSGKYADMWKAQAVWYQRE